MSAKSVFKAYAVELSANKIEDVVNAAKVLLNVFKGDIAAEAAYSYAYNDNEAAIISEAVKAEAVKISVTNRKLNALAKALGLSKSQVVAIDGVAGQTCPFANVCKAQVNIDESGSFTLIKDENCEFVCYAAKLEAVYKNVYYAHKHNTDIVDMFSKIRNPEALAAVIIASIWYKSPSIMRKGGVVRWHASGDFHTATYVKAARIVAEAMPSVQFFGYSKSPWVVEALTNDVNSWMVHSHGSKYDAEAEAMELPTNYVRCEDGQYENIPTACPTSMVSDDFFFIRSQKSFAINVH